MKRRAFLLAPLALAPARGLLAQTTATTLRIIVPAPAGSSADAVARLLADKLKGNYAPAVTVENVAATGGRSGVLEAKNAVSDGTTVLFTPDHPLTVYPHVVPNLGYDPLKDFAPIALMVRSPIAFALGTGSPADVKSPRDFAAWAKANPQRASCFAQGSAQLAAALFSREAGVRLARARSKQDAAILFSTLSDLVPDLRAGNASVLAVTGTRRAGLLPSVPTLAEAGYGKVDVVPWLGFFAPAGTPAVAVRRLVNAVNDASGYGAVQAELFKLGFDPVAMTPVGFANAVKADLERWASLAKATGFSAEG
jgi:tripartite-type tricarboxylate transporter receptor subunit TctC